MKLTTCSTATHRRQYRRRVIRILARLATEAERGGWRSDAVYLRGIVADLRATARAQRRLAREAAALAAEGGAA